MNLRPEWQDAARACAGRIDIQLERQLGIDGENSQVLGDFSTTSCGNSEPGRAARATGCSASHQLRCSWKSPITTFRWTPIASCFLGGSCSAQRVYLERGCRRRGGRPDGACGAAGDDHRRAPCVRTRGRDSTAPLVRSARFAEWPSLTPPIVPEPLLRIPTDHHGARKDARTTPRDEFR